jgi:hypothetical protein
MEEQEKSPERISPARIPMHRASRRSSSNRHEKTPLLLKQAMRDNAAERRRWERQPDKLKFKVAE